MNPTLKLIVAAVVVIAGIGASVYSNVPLYSLVGLGAGYYIMNAK